MKSHTFFKLNTLVATFLIASCSSGTDSGTTTLSLGLSDAPVDGASQVVVNIQGVHLHSPNGEDIIYQYCDDGKTPTDAEVGAETNSDTTVEPETVAAVETAVESEADATGDADVAEEDSMQMEATLGCDEPVSRPLNLLALTGGESVQLLDDIAVEPGRYPWVRLAIDESDPGYIVLLDGTEHPLSIPSGAQSGLKINKGFTATVNGDNRFMIDFDLRKSVNRTGNGYKLRPTLRMIQLLDTAAQRLTGTWEVTDMPEDCASPMAYVYDGQEGVVPDDIGGANDNPVTTASFVANEDGTSFSYQVDYLSPGDYTVAYTCQGNLDTADADEDLLFNSTNNVTVGSGDSAGS